MGNEIEVVKNLKKKKKSPGPEKFTSTQFYHTFKEDEHQCSSKHCTNRKGRNVAKLILLNQYCPDTKIR
jgi:hypothetical protein